MIKIQIKADGTGVVATLDNAVCTYAEVAAALFRLKQIENKLIQMQFDGEVSIHGDNK